MNFPFSHSFPKTAVHLAIFFLVCLFPLTLRAQKPVDLVYPFLDAANSRWFYFSSACRPFGMVNLSPDTETGATWGSGYRYDSEEIKGFSHVHAWQMSGVSLMPVAGEADLSSFRKDYYSPFTHEAEIVKPGYHKVFLDRFNTTVELTSTSRAGMHRISYPKGENRGLIVNLSGKLGPSEMKDGKIKQLGDKDLTGSVVNAPTLRRPKPVTVYFHIRLSEPIESIEGTGASSVLTLANTSEKPVLLKVGISYTSEEQARLNMEAEISDWDFDRIVNESQAEWNALLGRIRVEGGTEQARSRFYTDLWHSLQGRRIISDANGKYIDNTGAQPVIRQIPLGEDGKPLFNHHNSDSFWGAQWTIQTLWHLVYPERSADFCNSLLTYYRDGGLIPRGPSGGNYTYVMTGASSSPFLISAWQKGIQDFNVELAYEGLRKNHFPDGMMGHAGYEHLTAKWGGVDAYIAKGYVPYPLKMIQKITPFHKHGAGQTLEYSYQDHCLAQLAQRIGKESDYQLFSQRAQNYRTLYNPETGFMHPKNRKGEWRKGYDPYKYKEGFVESNGAQMTWHVPHDYQGLSELMGGNQALAEKLNREFEKAQEFGFTSGKAHAQELQQASKRIPINYGNQPSIQTAFIFNEVGAPRLTQKWSRTVLDSVYSGLSPYTGYNGDEDQGLMGSLAVLMKIGLFQLDGCTADSKYQISSPIFDRIEIDLSDKYYSGKTLIIEARNNSPQNKYIQSITWNGKVLDRSFLYHSELIQGGLLILELGE